MPVVNRQKCKISQFFRHLGTDGGTIQGIGAVTKTGGRNHKSRKGFDRPGRSVQIPERVDAELWIDLRTRGQTPVAITSGVRPRTLVYVLLGLAFVQPCVLEDGERLRVRLATDR